MAAQNVAALFREKLRNYEAGAGIKMRAAGPA
jgi:hypothetical protein